MKTELALCLALMSGSARTQTQSATAPGTCSVANTGSNSTITITCGDNTVERDALLKIVKKILARQLDTDAVMAKLDELEQVVKDNTLYSRVMTPEKLKAFVDALGKLPPTIINVFPAGAGEDIFPLAKQICDAVRQYHWPSACPLNRNAMVGDVDIEGIECYAPDWATKETVGFQEAMKAGGLQCKYISPSRNGITILIGRHPQSR